MTCYIFILLKINSMNKKLIIFFINTITLVQNNKLHFKKIFPKNTTYKNKSHF